MFVFTCKSQGFTNRTSQYLPLIFGRVIIIVLALHAPRPMHTLFALTALPSFSRLILFHFLTATISHQLELLASWLVDITIKRQTQKSCELWARFQLDRQSFKITLKPVPRCPKVDCLSCYLHPRSRDFSNRVNRCSITTPEENQPRERWHSYKGLGAQNARFY